MNTKPQNLNDADLLERSLQLRYAVHSGNSDLRRRAQEHEEEVRRRFTGVEVKAQAPLNVTHIKRPLTRIVRYQLRRLTRASWWPGRGIR